MAWSMARIGAGIALAWGLSGPALAQTFCDPDKPILSGRSDGYQDRGDRCEGVYAEQQVSGGFLEIASFTLGEVDYRLDGAALTLAWSAKAADAPVQIRAVSLRRNLHYQMDTRRPAGATSFRWPTEVLAQRRLEPDELGVRAWTDFPWGRGARELHLPLGVRQEDRQEDSGLYHLIVVPGLSLGGLSASLERLDEPDLRERSEFTEVIAETDLGSFHPAREPVPIELPPPEQPGVYRLRLMATPDRSGEPVTTFVWFRHPGS